MRVAIVLAAVLLVSGCYRTHYSNFHRPGSEPAASVSEPVRVTGWQHFFLYGWVPGERAIDARSECGGEAKIESIETRRTFLQGLVAAFAGYYINIYSPWNAAVFCTERPPAN